jgi:hypothetical protein
MRGGAWLAVGAAMIIMAVGFAVAVGVYARNLSLADRAPPSTAAPAGSPPAEI